MTTTNFSNHAVIQQANMLRQMNLYPFFRAIEESSASSVVVDGTRQIMIGSNNYLGLTHHPYVKEAAAKAIERFGTGCTGSRFLNGNLNLHEELEEKLANFLGHEAALIFPTGMQANLGAISAIAHESDCIFSDSENHASIIDAVKLSKAKVFKYQHNDMQQLEQLLETNRHNYEKSIIIADGVFSMTGSIIKLPEIVELAKKYNTLTYVDDAHGLGTLGDRGRGTANHFNKTDDVNFNMGTFSKSFASIGGYVSGTKDVIDFIRHTARSFIFSASMPPAAVATASACIDVCLEDESIFINLQKNVELMQKGFKDIGFFTYDSTTPVIPIFIGDDLKTMQVTKFLHENGIFATPVIAPAVPSNGALIRTSYMASHKPKDLEIVLETLAKAKKVFSIPSHNNQVT